MREQGFTLVEILVAMFILLIALVGLGAALAVQSGGIASSTSLGHVTITRANYQSVAAMLAQQRLEQVKRLQYRVGPPAVDEYGSDPIPAGFPDENSVQGFSNFSRQVRVQTGVPAANMKTITVTLTYNVPREFGMVPENFRIASLVAARP